MASDKSLAAEIEAVMRDEIIPRWMGPNSFVEGYEEAAQKITARIAANQSRAFEDGAPNHVVEALKREAQQQAFMRELAEQTYRGMREKFLRAAHRALDGGDDRALHRFVHTLESAVPIQGSSALPLQPEGERNV